MSQASKTRWNSSQISSVNVTKIAHQSSLCGSFREKTLLLLLYHELLFLKRNHLCSSYSNTTVLLSDTSQQATCHPLLYGKHKQQVTPRPPQEQCSWAVLPRGNPKLFCNLKHMFMSATAKVLHYPRPQKSMQVQALSLVLAKTYQPQILW